MDFPDHVDLGTVMDAPMLIAPIHVGNAVVHGCFVGEHCRFGKNLFTDDSKQCAAALIGSNHCGDFAFALYYADYASLVLRLVLYAANLSTVVRFIYLYAFARATERAYVLVQHGTNLLKH